ncbi:hypothetical protein AD998_13730 [bacterium 336/3]|jgi:uncharacterized protein|nr:hypothetical protein AD998_13730 [bacterium 336/3]
MSSTSKFLIGLIMLMVGLYVLLKSIHISNSFSMGYRFGYGSVGVPAGVLFLGFIIGVGMLFFNSKNPIGWLIMGGSVVMLIVGVIMNLHVSLAHMDAFSLLTIFGLVGGGGGLLLGSMRK